MITRAIAVLLTILTLGIITAAQERAITINIYNGGFSQISETRQVDIQRGITGISLYDIAQDIDPGSISLSGENFRVQTLNYRYDLLSGDRLLNKYIGQKLEFKFDDSLHTGVLLNFDDDYLYLTSDNKNMPVTIYKRGDAKYLKLTSMPSELVTKPTIAAVVDCSKSGKQDIDLSYMTTGLGWRAEYHLVYGGSNSGELTGWVNLDNQSGAGYPDAQVVLIAGQVDREQPMTVPSGGDSEQQKMQKPRKSSLEPLADYIRYKLPFTTTLGNLESKQALFFEPYIIEIDHYYKFKWTETKSDVKSILSFKNDNSAGTGAPLPEGRISIFDKETGAFLGSSEFKATPVDEKAEIELGTAFDITAERKRIDHKKIGRNKNSDSFEIKLRNHMTEKAKVIVAEELYGYWDIVEKSDDYTRKDFENIEFEIYVDPGKEKVITYTVEYSY